MIQISPRAPRLNLPPARSLHASPLESFVPARLQDPGLIPSPYARQPDSIQVRENEWRVGSLETPFVIHSGGCGAIKVFLEGESAEQALVFHSFGDAESKVVGRQIGNYLVRTKKADQRLRILCLQPYEISREVMESVNAIRDTTRQAGIPTEVRAVRLNNIPHDHYSEFVALEMAGSEEQILERHQHLRLKDRELSPQDRQEKIRLFQSLAARHRTPEFLKKWSGLSLNEAQQVVASLQVVEKTWSQRLLSFFT